MSRCVILAAGEIRDYQAVAAQIPSDAFVICADGGYAHCEQLGIRPDLLVGDFDSLPALPEAIDRVTLSPDKNYTDSWHAAEEALVRGAREILLAGMLGGRLDHTLANLGLLAHLSEQNVMVLLTDGIVEARALTGKGSLRIPPRPGCYFSLITLSPCEDVTIHNGKYPLSNYHLTASDPRAISNEFMGKPVEITQNSGALIVLSEPIQ